MLEIWIPCFKTNGGTNKSMCFMSNLNLSLPWTLLRSLLLRCTLLEKIKQKYMDSFQSDYKSVVNNYRKNSGKPAQGLETKKVL